MTRFGPGPDDPAPPDYGPSGCLGAALLLLAAVAICIAIALGGPQ
ncbi:MAG TPA: hypothetical protein VIV12_02115 [Streptosporangiaceae bacterium]